FGTTHSSFAYVHIKNPETIIVNSTWPGREGVFKIPTALEYNETYTQVINWGDLALYDELDDTVDDLNKRSRPIELFKLHLSNLRKDQKPWLPPQLDYRKVIVDYFTQMQILIKSTLERRWPTISFPQQVGLILTIPAEWEFLHFLERKVGFQALEKLKRCNYGQMQHLIRRFFCNLVKCKFKGDPTTFKTMRLILPRYCPDLQDYVTGEFKEQMEEVGWIVKLDFESVKGMFDPVVGRIIKLIDGQLNDVRERCRAIFLVGEFSESPYLLSRVREAFKDRVSIIAVPALPITAVVRGAIIYGLNFKPTHDLSGEASSVHRIYGMSALR
ncbi:hypothetical protein RhiirC2_800761, partial [Rhizophagus irregularis]